MVESERTQDYIILKDASKFLGEVQIVLSTLLILSSIAVISVYSVRVSSCVACENPIVHQHMIGLVTYSSTVFAINVFDIITAFFLISGSKNLNISRCQCWCTATVTTLILFTIVTLLFIFLLDDWLLLLAWLPGLILKPVGIWIVRGFIFKLRQECAKYFLKRASSSTPISPQSSSSSSPPNSRSSIKSTTVFILNRNDGSGQAPHMSYQKIPE